MFAFRLPAKALKELDWVLWVDSHRYRTLHLVESSTGEFIQARFSLTCNVVSFETLHIVLQQKLQVHEGYDVGKAPSTFQLSDWFGHEKVESNGIPIEQGLSKTVDDSGRHHVRLYNP